MAPKPLCSIGANGSSVAAAASIDYAPALRHRMIGPRHKARSFPTRDIADHLVNRCIRT